MKKNKSVIILLTTSLFVLTIIILEIKISSRFKSYNNEKESSKNLSDMITKNIKLSQKMLENIKNKGIEVVDIKIDECLANLDEENNFIKNLENLVIVNYVDANITVCTENKNCSLYRYLSYFGGISHRFSWTNYRTYNLQTYFNIFHISDFNHGHVLHIHIPEYINFKNINPSFENIKQHITKVLLTGLMELPFTDNKKTFLITFPTLINEFKLDLYNIPNNPLFKKYYYSEVWLGLLEAVYQYDKLDRIVLNLDPNDIII